MSIRGLVGGIRSAGATARLAETLRQEYSGAVPILTDSGTVALIAGLALAGRPGLPVRVALPAWGCPDLATSVDGVNGRAVLYDLDPQTLAPEWSSFREAVSRADAVVVAHFFGCPVDLSPARSDLERTGVWVIDDAAQGVGARLKGRPLGLQGDFGVLSFGRGKGRTGGSGGALLAVSERARRLVGDGVGGLGAADSNPIRLALKLAALWAFSRPELYWIPAGLPWLRLGESIYHPPPGQREMASFAAGVLLANQDLARSECLARLRCANAYRAALSASEGVGVPDVVEGAEPGWLRFPILALDPVARTRLSAARARRLGIMPGYPLELSKLPGFSRRVEVIGPPTQGAQRLAEQLFTLPTHSRVSPRVRDQVVAVVAG